MYFSTQTYQTNERNETRVQFELKRIVRINIDYVERFVDLENTGLSTTSTLKGWVFHKKKRRYKNECLKKH